MLCLSSHLHQWNHPCSSGSHLVPNPLSFLHMKFQMHLCWAKKSKIFFFRILYELLANLRLFVQSRPFTKKNVCFQNLMILLENGYVAQIIVNGFLHSFYFQNKFNCSEIFTQTHDQDWHLSQKVKCFVFVGKISKLSSFTNFNRVHSNCLSAMIWTVFTNSALWAELVW